jgi:iron complex transport system substrate-binding protein
MGQRRVRRFRQTFSAAVLVCVALVGCDRGDASARGAAGGAGTASTRPTVASLVPAATDMILAMGCRDQLVAISNYDEDRPETVGLPKVGDYLTNDWEQLGQIRPNLMVTQYDPTRKPPGLAQRADQLGIQLINVNNNRLDDVFRTMRQLGDAMKQPERAEREVSRVQRQLHAVAARVKGQAPVRTLIVLDDQAEFVAGVGTYLDELLTIAGGQNVLTGRNSNPYPRIDREYLLSLSPDVIIQLQPKATPQRIEQAKQTWAGLADLPAVKNGRVYPFTDWWVTLPASEVGDLAERFAEALHPERRANLDLRFEICDLRLETNAIGRECECELFPNRKLQIANCKSPCPRASS